MGIFGERVREARRRKDWSQKDLASAVGLKAEDSVGAWETRGVEPREPVKRAVAAALDVPYDWLTGDQATLDGYDVSPMVREDSRTFYQSAVPKRLPPKAYELIYDYVQKMIRAEFSPGELDEAEQFLHNAAYNKINARDPGEKSEEDIVLDIRAAWEFVRDVAMRGGRKL